MLADPAARRGLADLGVGLAVVTPSASMEDERAVRRLAPPGLVVHMASEIWFRYGVGQAATFVLVRSAAGGEDRWEAAGEVLGSATPASPAQLSGLVEAWLARSC